MSDLETLAEAGCFGGVQGFYRHVSRECGGPMRFAVFLPPQAKAGRVPSLFYLAGLTCTEETFPIKAGAQRLAAEFGLALIAPDTSPREPPLQGDRDAWDFGHGAGFYVDATREPWSRHYRMFSYVTAELPRLIDANFPTDPARRGVFGHSMGGHGALVCGFRAPEIFRSVSAFAPIAAPSDSPWGVKALTGYLGHDRADWAAYDASALARTRPREDEILVDQGLDDKFLAEQLKPERLEAACAASGQRLRLRRHAGYDHSYWFIQSFVPDHLAHHARALGA